MLGNTCRFSALLIQYVIVSPEMKTISNIVYWIPYLPTSTCFVLDLQDNIYNKVKQTHYVSAGDVGLGDLSIDICLEVENEACS